MRAAMIDPIALARQLIDIPSPTGDERAMGEAVERTLAKLGFVYTHRELYPPTGLEHPCYLLGKR